LGEGVAGALRWGLALTCLALGLAKVYWGDGSLYDWIGAGEIAVGAALLSRRTADLALWVLVGSLAGAGIAHLSLIAFGPESVARSCRCLGFAETSRRLVLVLHGTMLIASWLAVSLRESNGAAALPQKAARKP
jgi:hypothetical protein